MQGKNAISGPFHPSDRFKQQALHSTCLPDDLEEDLFLNRLPRLKLLEMEET